MADEHGHHHHHHQVQLTEISRLFVLGIILNLIFVAVEAGAGFYTNSLSLLSDAGHNLSDVATLLLSLFAFRISRRKATSKFTYGFHKTTILASLANAVILLIVVGGIGWEVVGRFMHPAQTNGKAISIVAAIGIVINGLSALLFFRDRKKDLNIRGAYLHLMADALVSLGVVLAGICIYYTGILWIDPLIGLVVMIFVLYSSWNLLKESLNLSLDAVPADIDPAAVKTAILRIAGIRDVHHIHIWAMSTMSNALTAHLLVEESLSEKDLARVKDKVRHELLHLNIGHATLETESVNCKNEDCADSTIHHADHEHV